MPRVETDGCSELTCIYHGEENRRKLKAIPVTDPYLDAPDGAVVEFEDGVTRERHDDSWEVWEDEGGA